MSLLKYSECCTHDLPLTEGVPKNGMFVSKTLSF